MKLSASPRQISGTPVSSSAGVPSRAKGIASQLAARVALSVGLLTGAACSDEAMVQGSAPAHASLYADAGRLGSTDAGQDSSRERGGDTSSADAQDTQQPKLPCSPIPYCPDIKLPFVPWTSVNYYLQVGRWFRVDPTTHKIHKVCEPVKGIPCDEKKGETPEKDGCDLPVCDDAKMCDPIPSSKVNPMYESPAFQRDFADFPQVKYAQSTAYDNGISSSYWFGSSLFDGTPDPVSHPMIFDNVPDCKVGEKPKEGASYYTCDIIPTCEKTIPYCEPLPRCEPGQAAISIISQDSESGLPAISSETCVANLESSLTWMTFPYHVDATPALEKLCGPDGLYPKNHAFTVTATMNCLPVPACKPGEKPVESSTPLPITIDLGTLGKVASTTGSYAPSCEPIPSCPKK